MNFTKKQRVKVYTAFGTHKGTIVEILNDKTLVVQYGLDKKINCHPFQVRLLRKKKQEMVIHSNKYLRHQLYYITIIINLLFGLAIIKDVAIPTVKIVQGVLQ